MSTQPTPQPDQVTASVEGTQPPVAAAPQAPPPSTSGGMFDKVLGALSGNPRTYSVDAQGQETSQPVTDRGSLAKHIVAAALVGLLKGAGARGPNSLGVAAAQGGQAGFALGQAENQNAKQEPLENYQRQQEAITAKANAVEKNLRMLSIAHGLGDQDKATHDAVAALYAPQIQQLEDEGVEFLGHQVPEQEAKNTAKYGLHPQRVIDGTVPRMGPDGKQVTDENGIPQWDNTYAIYEDHLVPFTPDSDWVKQANDWHIPDAKAWQGASGTISAVGQNHYLHMIAALQITQAEVNSFRKQMGQPPIDLKAMVEKNPSLIAAAQQFQRTSSASTQPDLQVDAMRQDTKGAAPYTGQIMGLFGADNLEKFKEDRVNKLAADKITANKNAEIAAETSPGNVAAEAKRTAALEAAKLPFELAKQKAEQAVKDGDPKAAAQLLVDGDVAPGQIISSRQPAFAQQAFTEAKKLDPNWNSQAAEGYFKAASSPANVQFFGSAKSLTDQNGTLDQLQQAYNNLPNGQIPRLNKIADWTSAAAGKSSTAAFAQTAIGVADDYAKVMGGGKGSDTAREEVLQSFARSHSPEQMQAAINAARLAVDSQMNSRIGQNPVMKKMYGDQMLVRVKDPTGATHTFRTQQQADEFKKKAGIQ